MPKFHRSTSPPPGALRDVRNQRLYGSPDEQIEAFAERARGCPDPDRATVYTRRRRTSRAKSEAPVYGRATDTTPAQHARNVAMLERNMAAIANAVRIARECGNEAQRAAMATRARELRAEWLKLTGGLERRVIEVDQGSAVNPMVAV